MRLCRVRALSSPGTPNSGEKVGASFIHFLLSRIFWSKEAFRPSLAKSRVCFSCSLLWVKALLCPPRQPPLGFVHCTSSFQTLSGQKAGTLRVVGLVLLPQRLLSLCELVPIGLPNTDLGMRHFCRVGPQRYGTHSGLQNPEAKDI